jgi:ribosomal-protein-serine acetyltransferase
MIMESGGLVLIPEETIRHDGITLRRWRSDDAETLHRVVNESLDHLAPWMPWAANGYSPEAASAYLAQSLTDWEAGTAYNYAIIVPGGEVVGSCGLMARIGPGGLEIGYWLHPAYQGQGIVTRAVAALTAEAFRIGADRVEIVHDADNVRSGAVPRRLGFVEVERRPQTAESTPPGTGVNIVWRRTR